MSPSWRSTLDGQAMTKIGGSWKGGKTPNKQSQQLSARSRLGKAVDENVRLRNANLAKALIFAQALSNLIAAKMF